MTLRPEARIDEVQDGVLHAADVLVDGEPVVRLRRIEGCGRVLRVGVAVEVPTGIDEGVHGVGLAARRATADRAGGVDEIGDAAQRRAALLRDLHLRGKQHGKRALGQRDHAAGRDSRVAVGAVDHGDRRAPVALAADAPVLQAICNCCCAKSMFLGECGHLLLRFGAGFAGPLAGIRQRRVVFGEIGKLPRIFCNLIRHNYAAHGKAVFIGEFEVALVVGGNAHDGASAVVGQNIICNPDRHKFAIEGIDGEPAGVDAVFFNRAEVARLARGLLLRKHLVDLRGQPDCRRQSSSRRRAPAQAARWWRRRWCPHA